MLAKTRELFVPAVITNVHTLDPGEIRTIELTLPQEYEIDSTRYPIRDEMRPGTAFLARPFGSRTGRLRRRMYTRSNCSLTAERVLETIINHTHQKKSDTSIWWQTEQVEELRRIGGTIDVRVDFNSARSELMVYENSGKSEPANLRLESDDEWRAMRFLGIAFSTGITPFLSQLRYMQALDFWRTGDQAGVQYTLIASARNPRQLMNHAELIDLNRRFPKNFWYHPVLTREWPDDWGYTKGRIIRVTGEGERTVDIAPLLEVVPNIHQYHVRMCGNKLARDQLEQGLRKSGQVPLSFRAEVW